MDKCIYCGEKLKHPEEQELGVCFHCLDKGYPEVW